MVFQQLRRFDLVENPQVADVLVVKETKQSIREFWRVVRPRHIRFFFGGEAIFPDFNAFDFAIGFDHIDFGERYLRLHPSVRYSHRFSIDVKSLKKSPAGLPGFAQRKFCEFTYSNRHAHPMRDSLFREITRNVSPVDSLGNHLNNGDERIRRLGRSGNWVEDKVSAQKGYRFSIVAENATYGGYTSEKLLTSLLAGQVPIYWGNPSVVRDFNSERIIEYRSEQSVSDLFRRVSEINKDEALWTSIASADIYTASQLEELAFAETVLGNFIERIFNVGRPLRGIGAFPDRVETIRLRSRHSIPKRFGLFLTDVFGPAWGATKPLLQKLRRSLLWRGPDK